MDLLLSPFFNSRIALVDLDAGRVEIVPVPKDMAARGMGGIGTASLLHGRYRASDPLVLGTGPLTGSFAPASCLLTATFSHPATGGLVHVPFMAHAGPHLKFSGVDFLVVLGRARGPVTLDLLDGTVRISFADNLEGTLSERRAMIESRRGQCPDTILLTGSAADSGSTGAVLSSGLWGSLDKASLGTFAAAKNIRAVTLKATKGIAFPKDGMERGAALMRALRRESRLRRSAIQERMAGPEAAQRLIRKHYRKSHACYHCPLACVSYLEYRPFGQGTGRFRAPAQGLFVMDHEGFAALAARRGNDAPELMRHCIELGYDPVRAAREISSHISTTEAIERITGLCAGQLSETLPDSRDDARHTSPVSPEQCALYGAGIPGIMPSDAGDEFNTWQRRVSLAMVLGICPVGFLYFGELRADDLLAFVSADTGALADLHAQALDLCDSLSARRPDSADAASSTV